MTSKEIAVSGVAYLRSREAARVVHLAPDYISRLARGGFIAGQLLDGLWFVSLDSLHAFMADQERQKKLWRARLAAERREEQRLAGHPSVLSA